MARIMEETDTLETVLEGDRTESARHGTEQLMGLPVCLRIRFTSRNNHSGAPPETGQNIERTFVHERSDSDMASDFLDFGGPAAIVVELRESTGDE